MRRIIDYIKPKWKFENDALSINKGDLKKIQDENSNFLKKHNEHFYKMVLEEYKVLRLESLRLNQDISTILWIGLTGFIGTIGATAIFLANKSANIADYLPLATFLLCLQSLAASAMFAFEVERYARVGRYIRMKIERTFIFEINCFKSSLYWEHWISKKRVRWFYIISAIILQLPIIFTTLLLPLQWIPGSRVTHIFPSLSWFSSFVKNLCINSFIFWALLFIIVIDLFIFIRFFHDIRCELRNEET